MHCVDKAQRRDFFIACIKESDVLHVDNVSGYVAVDGHVLRTAAQHKPSHDRSPPQDAVMVGGEVEEGTTSFEQSRRQRCFGAICLGSIAFNAFKCCVIAFGEPDRVTFDILMAPGETG